MPKIPPAEWPDCEVVSTIEAAIVRELTRRGAYQAAQFAEDCSGGMGGIGPFETLKHENLDWTGFSVRDAADHWIKICEQPENRPSVADYPDRPPAHVLPDDPEEVWSMADTPEMEVFALVEWYNFIEAFQLANAADHARDMLGSGGFVRAVEDYDCGRSPDLHEFSGAAAAFLVSNYAGDFPEFERTDPVKQY